nr:prenyltransferase [Bdellovibrionales bacterium]
PSWGWVYLRSTRPELLPLTLGPAFAAWLSHPVHRGFWPELPSWFALVGIFFLHTAVFLFNDVQDHVHGWDRQNRQRGSQVIQKGWVPAIEMKRWAWVNFTLALIFGTVAAIQSPLRILGVCGLAALALAIVVREFGTRYALVDLALLLLFGPLLTVGVALASSGEAHLFDVLLGFAFGALTVWVFQVRQFENLFRASPESAKTFLGYQNFDRARWICLAEGAVLLVLQPLVALALRLPLIFFVLAPLVSIPLILTLQRILRAASPLSSTLIHSSRWALASHLSWTLWWILALGVMWL